MGYEGNLCSRCSITSEYKYERENEFECRKWQNPLINSIRVFGLMLLMFCFFMLIIIINVRKTQESELSVLLRIMTNYLQLITTSMSMSLSYPEFLNSIVGPIVKLGGSSDTFLSFDWFITDNEIKGPFESNAVFKLFLLAFLPIALFIVISIIWLILYVINTKYVKDMTRNLVISFISIVFLLHPKLTQQSINTFRWIQIGEDTSVARFDMDIEWYSAAHIKYCLFLALPILIVWVISMPVSAFVLLLKHRKECESNKVKEYFLIFYQGLTPHVFYWEFVNTLRKTIVLASLLLSDNLKIAVSSLTLIITGRLQLQLKPYKNNDNNKIEFLAIVAGVVTILSSFIFTEKQKVNTLNNTIVIFVIMLNIIFILQWVYLLSRIFKTKFAQIVISSY